MDQQKPKIRIIVLTDISSLQGGFKEPDDEIRYSWQFYPDCSSYKNELTIKNFNCEKASFVAAEVYFPRKIHIILTVSDNGQPSLSSYRRVVITVDPNK